MKRCLLFLLAFFASFAPLAHAVVCPTGTNSSAAWAQLSLPSGMTTGSASVASLFASSNCYLYVSMIGNGTWEAKVSDLRDHPTTASDWTEIDSGFPAATQNSGTAEVNSWTQDSSGNIYAGIGSVGPGLGCSYCVVGKWNGSTWSFSANPPGTKTQLRNLQVDASNNIYLSDLSADFWESTNGGSTFTSLVTDAYTGFGYTSGYNYAMALYNGQIYWGGEGAYMKSPANMSSGTAMWATTAAGYGGNAQVIVGDGNASTSPTYLIAVSRILSSGPYSISRYVVATNTWTDLSQGGTYNKISNHALYGNVVAGEYLGGWNSNIYRSTDSGVTWSIFSTGLPSGEQASDKQIAISPWDDSFYTATDPTSSGQHELWVYPKTSSGGGSADTPTFSPVAGTYSSTQSVTISTALGGVICYNTTGSPATNGTTGCTTGTHYTSPVSVSTSETLYAVAGGTGYTDSTVGSAAYTITAGSADTPTFSPVAGTYSGTQSVTISTALGGVICYNTTGSPATNGTTGCTTGTHYTSPVSVSASETLYAVAGGTGYTDSSVGSAAYTISGGSSVVITANVPAYPFGVLPGSVRTINVNITGGTLNTVTWTASGTSGTSALFTDSTHTLVSSVSGLPVMQVTIGSTPGTATITPGPGNAGPYTFSSTGVVTVTATSNDDPTKSAHFNFNVGQNSTAMLPNGQNSVVVTPAYQQAYKSQPMSLQSWVVGCVDETGTWSITSQPSGGNGTLSDTTYRDTVFTASVTGRYTVQYADHCNSGVNTAIVYVSPNNMPSWAAAGNTEKTEPRECYVDPALTGPDYEIGAGKAYTTIGSTPSITGIGPGTIYRLWNTDTTGLSPSTFPEYFQIQQSGSATQPIIFCGVTDSLGNLPIMDGNNATSSDANISIGAAAGYGVMSLWMAQPHYGYWQDAITPYSGDGNSVMAPAYVLITGLHTKNARPGNNYTQPGGVAGVCPDGSGTHTTCGWVAGAAGINLRSGIYVDFSGNDIDNNSNGTFLAENSDNSGFVVNTTNVTIRGNHIQNSGVAGSPTYHQLYVQCFYCLIEGNLIDNYNATASGSMLKWRGVEGIIRYNNIQTGAQRVVDMVEVQDAAGYLAFEYYLGSIALYANGDRLGPNLTWYQESKQKDFVYGNMLWGASALDQVHYAEDNIGDMTDRNGFLNFYNNTLDSAAIVFAIGENNDGYNPYLTSHVNTWNNIFWAARTSGLNSTIQMGDFQTLILSATTNLLTTLPSSYSYIANPIPISATVSYSSGYAFGWPNSCDLTCLWPLSAPMNTHIYGLTNPNFLNTATQPYNSTTMVPQSGSAAIGAASALTGLAAQLPVRYQYSVSTGQLVARTRSSLDIGAEDSGGTPQASTPTFSPVAGTYSGTQSVTISTSLGSVICYNTTGSPATNGTTGCTTGTHYTSPVSVSASETLYAVAGGTGYVDSSVGSAAYTITGASTYSCTPTTTGAGTGTYLGTNCPASGLATGASYSATATALTGSTFSTITSCPGTITGNVCAGTIGSSNVTTTASFSLNSWTLTVNTPSNGTITGCSTGAQNYGASVSCTPVPNSGYATSSITGTCGGSGNPYIFSMPNNACAVSATFTIISPSSGVTINGLVTTTGTITIQ